MILRDSSRIFFFWLIWIAFIIYGSLMPFELRPHTMAAAIEQFRHIPFLHLGVVSRADWIANILLYMPFSYLGATWLSQFRGLPRSLAFIIVAIFGVALAIGVEFTQIFFAPRTVSLNDLIAESIGTILGLALWSASHSRLAQLFSALLTPGPMAFTAGLTLYALAYLALALFPYDFLVSVTDLQWKLREGNYGWGISNCGPAIRCGGHWLAEAIATIPLGLFLTRILPQKFLTAAKTLVVATGIGFGIEAAQFLLVSGISTASAALAQTSGISLGLWIRSLPSPRLAQRYASWLRPLLLISTIPYFILITLLNGWLYSPWVPIEFAKIKINALHWLPFYYQYFTSETEAVRSVLTQTAIYLPLGIGFWLWHASGITPLKHPPRLGLLMTSTTTAFAVETFKLFLAGAHPDPTNMLIAPAAAWLGQSICNWLTECSRISLTQSSPRINIIQIPYKRAIGMAFVLLAVGIIGLTAIRENTDTEAGVLAPAKHELPTPASLGPVSLPNFRLQHPRLPSPTPQDIARLKNENSDFIGLHLALAKGGRGKLESSIIMAYLEPGSQDLQILFDRLMSLQFAWRGNEQGKPLAQGYDWLYAYWSADQRRQLQEKLVHGCNYLIDQIRGQTLSPYNVILYNTPFQALMACSIALYKDDPRGEPVMAFTQDLWKNRVLPAWRQIMGKNGGWHEGGEYVGLGIGGAIYEVPNMWRRATGEDYFKSEPGIRGFLDFLVYRSRPDATQMRLGDAAWFDRQSPDRLALALEYRNAAAYSLSEPPKVPTPTSWPWGPLTDRTLYDPKAVEHLPLTKYFDGIGLVVMRSGWGPDATYITFKAGDNYWSHSHLDQGAFTIYKGGALAIDSGLYPAYGTDHHMNYTYQTIAHNVVTVTDPNDTVPLPAHGGDKNSRTIANDGGQRRVGSGWGIDPAPLDVNEWTAKREIYHTGEISHISENEGITTIVADLTSAYTNRFSGKGTFSHRTRRVERYIRSFVYDRLNDALVIYDQLIMSQPSFTPRWLLHTIEEPVVSDKGFKIRIASTPRMGHEGGSLTGNILLPERAKILKVGGPGHEFEVDGHNYDNQGEIYKLAMSRPLAEPGAWRVEVSPGTPSDHQNFLVALFPKQAQDTTSAPPVTHLLKSGDRIGCEIMGPRRHLEIWFNHDGGITVAPQN